MVEIRTDESNATGIIVGTVILAVVSIYALALVIDFVGGNALWSWLASQSAWVRYTILLTGWTISFVVVAGVLLGVLSAVGIALVAGVSLIERISNLIARGLVACASGAVWLLKKAGVALTWPLRLAGEAAWEAVQGRVLGWVESWRQAQKLRRVYREEYADEFRSFQEFKRQFDAADDEPEEEEKAQSNSDQGSGENRKQDVDPFKAACQLLGLADDGGFSQSDLKQRYRALMKGVHPDVAGQNGLAAQINSANALINERKGWK